MNDEDLKWWHCVVIIVFSAILVYCSYFANIFEVKISESFSRLGWNFVFIAIKYVITPLSVIMGLLSVFLLLMMLSIHNDIRKLSHDKKKETPEQDQEQD